MRPISDLSSKYLLGCGLALSLFAPLAGACAQETNLYSFTGGNDGGNPPCGLISGGHGVLPSKARFYGVTYEGGTSGDGTVYEIGNTGFETVLHSFAGGGSDGAYPLASLVMDAAGNLYGTTSEGGTYGVGTVFKITPGGSETVLYSFAGGASDNDGAYPFASLIMDASGNLYGTTEGGGAYGYGTVFEVAPGGTETVLHSFAGSDGANPYAGLVMDTSGNLYGTTSAGGSSTNCTGGCGTIFKLAPGSGESVLHNFAGGSDGATPYAGLFMQKSLSLYGTTFAGGSTGDGVVFEFTHKGKEIILHSFAGGSDGATPVAGVIEKGGYLYGTTYTGGTHNYGTVYRTPDKAGADTVLYTFTGGSDGGLPEGGVLDQGGNLFGTAFAGGNPGCVSDGGCGVVFELTP